MIDDQVTAGSQRSPEPEQLPLAYLAGPFRTTTVVHLPLLIDPPAYRGTDFSMDLPRELDPLRRLRS